MEVKEYIFVHSSHKNIDVAVTSSSYHDVPGYRQNKTKVIYVCINLLVQRSTLLQSKS